jgi:hypothetical protein
LVVILCRLGDFFHARNMQKDIADHLCVR